MKHPSNALGTGATLFDTGPCVAEGDPVACVGLGLGVVTLGARAFNSAEARFLSVDPVFGGCANAYIYAHGDPLSQEDLTGQACFDNLPGLIFGGLGFIAGIFTLFLDGIPAIVVGAGAGAGAGIVGGAAAAWDAPACFQGDAGACVATALGGVGAGLGFLGAAAERLAMVATGADALSMKVMATGAGLGGVFLGGAALEIDGGTAVNKKGC